MSRRAERIGTDATSEARIINSLDLVGYICYEKYNRKGQFIEINRMLIAEVKAKNELTDIVVQAKVRAAPKRCKAATPACGGDRRQALVLRIDR